MGGIQGYNKRYKSTTLSIYKNDRDRVELLWHDDAIQVYMNNEYVFTVPKGTQVSSVSEIENFDPTKISYIANQDYVSYVNAASPSEDYTVSYIYRCIEDTSIGESPESNPEKWERQGLSENYVAENLTVDDIFGLQDLLDGKINYSDLSEDFSVDPDTKQVSLNLNYITLNSFSGKDYVQPDLLPSAEIIVSTSSVNVLEGNSVSASVYLTREPTGNVVLSITSDDENIATVDSSFLTFTTENYSTPQIITISGVSDLDADDDTTTVSLSVSTSSDTNYVGISSKTISVYVTDIDNPDVILSNSTLNINEGESGLFNVYLSTMPSDDVTISITESISGVVSLSSSSLTFTDANYNTPQSITVTAVSDSASFIDKGTTLTLTTASNDSNYDNVSGKSINVVNINVDEPIPLEVQVGSNIWRTYNEDWNDHNPDSIHVYGGDSSEVNSNYDFNLATYGRLYEVYALPTYETYMSGYRIPTLNDLLDFMTAINGTYTTLTTTYRCDGKPTASNVVDWDVNSTDGFSEAKYLLGGLYGDIGSYLVPGGYTYDATNISGYTGLGTNGTYWYKSDTDGYYGIYSIIATDNAFGGTDVILLIRTTLYSIYASNFSSFSLRLIKDI